MIVCEIDSTYETFINKQLEFVKSIGADETAMKYYQQFINNKMSTEYYQPFIKKHLEFVNSTKTDEIVIKEQPKFVNGVNNDIISIRYYKPFIKKHLEFVKSFGNDDLAIKYYDQFSTNFQHIEKVLKRVDVLDHVSKIRLQVRETYKQHMIRACEQNSVNEAVDLFERFLYVDELDIAIKKKYFHIIHEIAYRLPKYTDLIIPYIIKTRSLESIPKAFIALKSNIAAEQLKLSFIAACTTDVTILHGVIKCLQIYMRTEELPPNFASEGLLQAVISGKKDIITFLCNNYTIAESQYILCISRIDEYKKIDTILRIVELAKKIGNITFNGITEISRILHRVFDNHENSRFRYLATGWDEFYNDKLYRTIYVPVFTPHRNKKNRNGNIPVFTTHRNKYKYKYTK